MKLISLLISASLATATPIANARLTDDTAELSILETTIPDSRHLSYDEVLRMLEWIESDDFDERCSIEELTHANQLISFLAAEGATVDEQMDIAISAQSLFVVSDCLYAYWSDFDISYAHPAILRNEPQHAIHCKNWFHKQWNQTRLFVRKHKKAILIGAIVVVAVTVVVVAAAAISASAATAAAGGIAGSAGALDTKPNHAGQQERALDPSLQEQISKFKETIAQEQMGATLPHSGISMEENGRMIGSIFTHKTVDTLTELAAKNPSLISELQNLTHHPYIPTPRWENDLNSSPHTYTDLAFSTNYSSAYSCNDSDLNALTYQTRGNWALSMGSHSQAIQDFGRAIEIEPNNASHYLGRGVAYFELGEYEQSVADYRAYVSQSDKLFSATDFAIGFAKGLPKGICDSGETMLQFVTDLACHPFQTGEKVYDSFSALSRLVKSGEWAHIGEALSPELHQLLSEWDSLSSTQKGELSGYAFGKHGADILLPGTVAKVVSKSAVAVNELGAVLRNLQSAERVLLLEAVAEGSSAGINIGEVVASANTTFAAAEELGLTTKEIAALKQSGEIQQIIGKGRDFFGGNSELQASFDQFQRAEKFLQNYKEFMTETQARDLIHQAGIRTFPRPEGIPDRFRVKITNDGAGLKYIHPNNEQTYIRVMPGKLHSKNPAQQKPYVTWMKNGETLDKNGNVVNRRSIEAHIPLEDFKYVQ